MNIKISLNLSDQKVLINWITLNWCYYCMPESKSAAGLNGPVLTDTTGGFGR